MLQIEPFQVQDREQVVALWRSCDLVVPWNDPERDIDRKLRVQPELFLVGRLGDDVVASVMCGYEGHRGWINYLAVSPEHRGRGYAAALLDEVESRLLAMGCPKINLQIRATNTRVAEFYKHLGYVEDQAISMGKRLIPDGSQET